MATDRVGRGCKTCKDTHKPGTLVKLPVKSAKNQAIMACDRCDGPVVELAFKQAKAA